MEHASAGPRFSVVMPTYDRSAMLPVAVGSVLAQTAGDFELVIVDDGSTDDTPRVVAELGDPRIRYVHQVNQGRCVARNTGVGHASGRFVVFIDDDDSAMPHWLERFGDALDGAGDDCVVVCCGEVLLDEDDTPIRTNLPGPLGPAFADYDGWFLPGTFVVRRDVFERVGGFLPGLEHNDFTELTLRMVAECRRQGWSVQIMDEPLVRRHVGGERIGVENIGRIRRGMEYTLERHREQLARSSWVYAQYSAVAGVAAAQTGDFHAARHHFWRAVRVRPREWRHWVRLLLTWVPPVGRRVWGRHGFRVPSPGTG